MNKCITCGGTTFSKIDGEHALMELVKQNGQNYLNERSILPLRAETCTSCNRVDFFLVKN